MSWFETQLAIYANSINKGMQEAFDDLYDSYGEHMKQGINSPAYNATTIGSTTHEQIDNLIKNNKMSKKQVVPFEVLILERKGEGDNETVEIVKVNDKEVNISLGVTPQAVAQAASMRLGPEYADRADKIDVLVRPFVKG